MFSKQVALLYQQAKGATFASSLTAILVCLIIRQAVPGGVLVAWISLFGISTLARVVIYGWRKRSARPDDNAAHWANLYTYSVGFSGLCWGAGPLLFAPYLNAEYQIILSVIVAGICAASLPILSPVPRVYRAFAGSAIMPLAFHGFLSNHPAGLELAIAATVLLVLMMFTSHRLTQAVCAALRVQFNSDELLISLKEEISIRKAAEQSALQSARAARQNQARFKQLAAAANEGLVFHEKGLIINANQAFARMLDTTEDALVGRSLLAMAAQGQGTLLQDRLESNREEEFETVLADCSSRQVPVAISSRQFDYEGRTVQLASILDLSDKRAAEAKMHYLAQHDGLTGLPNRSLLVESLKQSLSLAKRQQVKLGMLMFDLDRFKAINDSLGHDVGDLLICAAGERLKQNLRTEDVIARPGSDEFLIVLPYVRESQDLARAALKLLRCFEAPFVIEGQELYVTFSIGIGTFPDDGETPEQLILRAETAMYQAKKSGGNSFAFYAAEMSALARENLHLENQLRHAIDNREFLLHYQPQLNLQSGRIVGVEALIRWNQPEQGLIAPLKFIPVAEVSGLIVPIGEWVMLEACRQAQDWQNRGADPIRVGINVSARQFKDPDLVTKIAQCLETTGLDPRLLELELTESIVMEEPLKSAARLNQLRDLGISISIDDFGTGYSSLSYLKQFPIDVLKIDRSFVRDVNSDPHNAAIVTAILAMARQLKIEVVAEGIETVEQRAFLEAYGCDIGQGYFFSKPLPAAECEKLFERRLARVLPLSVVK